MDYSEYLFSCLLKNYSKYFRSLEYDLQFRDLKFIYKLFEESPYNKESESEYDCMVLYLKAMYGNNK